MKKIQPRLLSSVLKTNEDAIRPLHTRIPTTPTSTHLHPQKPFRLSSDSILPPITQKQLDPRKPLSCHKQLSSGKLILFFGY